MKKLSLLGLLSAFIIGVSTYSEACTGLQLTAKDGTSVHGRTFEFGIKIPTSVVMIPRNYSFTGTTPLGKGLVYQSKYAAVGTICFNDMVVMDGMNEKGLSVGTFYFPKYAGYRNATQENKNKALSPIDFSNWIITQFSTIDEVKAALPNMVIVPTVYKDWGNIVPPFHYVIYDKGGKSIVIEPINGELVVYDNPLGVITNSPTFDWLMTYLQNFVNLNPKNIEPLKLGSLVLTPFGQGSGMVGLPGDFTPPSRFVRAAIFSQTATPPSDVKEAISQIFHILNQFDIPIGIARENDNGIIRSDYTLATVVHDPINLKYYFRTYEDQTMKFVDLNAFDKQAKEIKVLSTAGEQTYLDVSKDLKTATAK